MTYKALVKTAESYLYDAQSDLQVLVKRGSENHPCVFSDTLKSVEYALNDIERIHNSGGLYETGGTHWYGAYKNRSQRSVH